jgi:hypothetical protein
LVETKGPADFEIPELKTRTQESSRSKITKHYKALSQGKEVAFISLDPWPEPPQMVVYEISVPQFARRQGIATAVLKEVERISACDGLSVVRLRPSPLDSSITMDALIDSYNRKGYECHSSVPGELDNYCGNILGIHL